MFFDDNIPAYLSGAFGGICIMVLVLSLLIGYAYDEFMLWWHASTLLVALPAWAMADTRPHASAALWLLQMALASETLRQVCGDFGSVRRPAIALRWLALAFTCLAGAVALIAEEPGIEFAVLLPLWVAAAGWYLLRARSRSGPWMVWLGLGQLALAAQWLLEIFALQDLRSPEQAVYSFAALAAFAICLYVAMVWSSRLHAENVLRLKARERTDPLTGLATQLVFFDRADGAIVRSRNMAYDCALMLIRVENIEQIVTEQNLENNEGVLLAASGAIAAALRSQDSAARLAGNRFAVVAEGIAEGAANKLATQILANGLRADEWGLRGSQLHFQIAYVEIRRADVASSAVLSHLEELLLHMSEEHASRHIKTLPRIEGLAMAA